MLSQFFKFSLGFMICLSLFSGCSDSPDVETSQGDTNPAETKVTQTDYSKIKLYSSEDGEQEIKPTYSEHITQNVVIAGAKVERRVALYSDDSVVNDGIYTEYWDQENVYAKGMYRDGKKIGKWEFFWLNGNPSRTVSYKNDLLDGSWQQFREDGSLKAKVSYKDGKRQGAWENYYEPEKDAAENATPRIDIKQTFVNGKREGQFVRYHKNGKPYLEVDYKNSKMNGKYTKWYENGNRAEQGQYQDNKRTGRWAMWYENGKTKTLIDYKIDGNSSKGTIVLAEKSKK